MALTWQSVDLSEDPDVPRFEHDPAELVDALAVLLEIAQRPAWHALAACRGTGVAIFYPGRGESHDEAHELCAGCPVRGECLSAALQVCRNDDFGVWGGTSMRERKGMRRSAQLGTEAA